MASVVAVVVALEEERYRAWRVSVAFRSLAEPDSVPEQPGSCSPLSTFPHRNDPHLLFPAVALVYTTLRFNNDESAFVNQMTC